jgi:hypothetical protein
MRGETVADGIKRRMAETTAARRKAMRLYVQIAIWSGAAGVVAVLAGVVAVLAAGRGFH